MSDLPAGSTPPRLAIIAAVARNGVIGRDNGLPWRLPADLRRFKTLTLGHPVIMGRRTWESIGRPLPGRRNLVVSRNSDYAAPGAELFASLARALAACAGHPGEVFVIGGAELYALALPAATRLYLTEIRADYAGDAHFPALDRGQWREDAREAGPADSDPPFDFVSYVRRGS